MWVFLRAPCAPSFGWADLSDQGTFKLTVFSDLHFGENPWDDWGPEQDRKSIIVMTDMLKLERPDFVAINGDLITGESTVLSTSGLLR